MIKVTSCLGNGLSLVQRKDNNNNGVSADFVSLGQSETKPSAMWIQMQNVYLKNHFEMLSAKTWPFCSDVWIVGDWFIEKYGM